MKAFLIYTGLRLLLFVVTFGVFAGLWVLLFGSQGVLLVPFLLSLIVSMGLSLKLLAPQRERLALQVQQRAERAANRFDELKSKEDAD